MNRATALGLLLSAAVLEAGGDALIRSGLRAPSLLWRACLFGGGALALFAYGYVVNTPSWSFGRLLGVYVVFFFLVAQLISWVAFQRPPSRPVLIGGTFIVLGGLILARG